MNREIKSEEPLQDLAGIIRSAFVASTDFGPKVEALIAEGAAYPLDEAELKALVRKIVITMRRGAARRGDTDTLKALADNTENIVTKVTNARSHNRASVVKEEIRKNGSGADAVDVSVEQAVTPSPVYHGRRVAMRRKRMNTKDIPLWTGNERLDIHLEQFRAMNGRAPTNEEMLGLLHGTLQLPGVGEENKEDPFWIKDLADSIAHNGVRQPPILDSDGVTLLDGNRRVAACAYILFSDDYEAEAKKQAETIWVWQLTEHADDDDRQAVIVSLNFESDCKLEWPDFVRARKVADDYDSMRLRVGEANMDKKKDREIRRALARKYALKPQRVALYLQMVNWAERFEAYHVDEAGRDVHAVRHFGNENFSYFKELSDGMTKDDGVARILSEDPDYRGLVFDLLFEGKFKNWESIRMLKHRDDQLERELKEARAEKDSAIGKRNVTLALNAAYERHVDKRRTVGAEQTIQAFMKFLGKLPPEAYLDADTISTDSLQSLATLCTMALENANEALKARGA